MVDYQLSILQFRLLYLLIPFSKVMNIIVKVITFFDFKFKIIYEKFNIIPNNSKLKKNMSNSKAIIYCPILGNSSSSESSTSEDEIDNCQALTDIARGCTASAIAGDFFGDGELSGRRS